MKQLLIILLFFSNFVQAEGLDSLSFFEKYSAKRDTFAQRYDKYRSGGLYLTYTGFQDTRMSPLIHRGIGFAVDAQILTYGARYLESFQTRFMYTPSFSSADKDNPMHLGRFDFNYSHQRRIKLTKNKLYVGADLNNLLNGRLYAPLANNSIGIDNSVSLSPSATFIVENYPYENCNILISGGFSVVSFSVRYPEFAYTGVEMQFLGLSRFNRYYLEIGIAPKLKYSSENRMYFSYGFDAYNFASSNDDKKIAQYMHRFKFTYWLKKK